MLHVKRTAPRRTVGRFLLPAELQLSDTAKRRETVRRLGVRIADGCPCLDHRSIHVTPTPGKPTWPTYLRAGHTSAGQRERRTQRRAVLPAPRRTGSPA